MYATAATNRHFLYIAYEKSVYVLYFYFNRWISRSIHVGPGIVRWGLFVLWGGCMDTGGKRFGNKSFSQLGTEKSRQAPQGELFYSFDSLFYFLSSFFFCYFHFAKMVENQCAFKSKIAGSKYINVLLSVEWRNLSLNANLMLKPEYFVTFWWLDSWIVVLRIALHITQSNGSGWKELSRIWLLFGFFGVRSAEMDMIPISAALKRYLEWSRFWIHFNIEDVRYLT